MATTPTSTTAMLDGTNSNIKNNNNNNNNDRSNNNNNLSVSEFSLSNDEGVGKRSPTVDILALHHQHLAQKEVPVLFGGTGSIDGSGAAAAAAAAAVPLPPIITTTTKTAYSNNNNDKSIDSNNGNDNNIDAEVIIVPPTVTIFDNANWNDIEISVGPTNLTHTQNSNSDKTKLKSIKGVDIGTITLTHLRKFASRMNIPGSRKATKINLCDMIIELKRKYDESDSTDGLLKSVSKDSKDASTDTTTTNSFRLLNVIFHADNYDRLDERAASLDKDDLDSGKKTGQQYYEFLASKYNSDKEDYGENHYPEIIKCDPSIHGTMTWMKARTGFNKFIKQYEKCINNQSVSGTHDVLVDSLDKVEEDGKKLSDCGKGRIL